MDVIEHFAFAIGQVNIISWDAIIQQLKFFKLILEILIKTNYDSIIKNCQKYFSGMIVAYYPGCCIKS